MSSQFTSTERKKARQFLDAALEQDELGTLGSDARALNEAFLSDLIARLGGSPQSSEHLQQLAQDFLDGDATATLRGPEVILPSSPSSQTFSNDLASLKLKKHSKCKASEDSATRSPAKKRRFSGKGKKTARIPAENFSDPLELSAKAPAPVRKTILAVLTKAADEGKKPWCQAFSTSGRTLFYDPNKYWHVLRSNWRSWMANRRALWG